MSKGFYSDDRHQKLAIDPDSKVGRKSTPRGSTNADFDMGARMGNSHPPLTPKDSAVVRTRRKPRS